MKPTNSALSILVFERSLVSQTEWDARHASVDRFMEQHAAKRAKPDQFEGEDVEDVIKALEPLQNLPPWHHQGRVGWDALVEDPDVVYPEMELDVARSQAADRRTVAILSAYEVNDDDRGVRCASGGSSIQK